MTTSTTEAIRRAEGVRTRALEAADVAELEPLLADDFIYVHSSGRTETKDAYLASLGSGDFRWSGFRHEDTAVRPLADTALLYGLLHARKEEAGHTRQLLFRFVSVWVRSGAEWQMAFMQNLKPEPSESVPASQPLAAPVIPPDLTLRSHPKEAS